MKNHKKIRDPFKIFPGLLSWLAKCLTKSSTKELHLALGICNKIFMVYNTRGKHECITYSKGLRLNFTKYIFNMDRDFNSQEKSYPPKILRPIYRYIDGKSNYPFIRLIYSSLYITRFIRLDPEPSFSTIKSGPRKGTPSLLLNDIVLFLKEIGINTKRDLNRIPKSLHFKEFHMTSKSGPNGHALWTSFKDAKCLSPLQLEAIQVIGGDKVSDLIKRNSLLYSKIPQFFESLSTRKGSLSTRKLVALSDKEGKTREVAIFDYYSQAVLLPLHNKLMKRLSLIRQDCTMDQTKLFDSLTADTGSSYHSIDLTAFTDRFPISVNYQILSVWFGEDFAKAWMQLMVYTPFQFNGEDIYYLTGNPMGGYSSWASTSLAHHFLVFLACKRANRNWRRCPYMLLGDDLVIANDAVAKAYKEYLEEWGIDFSIPKTHVSQHGFEFAKQIRLHGTNVSPFPLAALYERQSERIATLGIILSEISNKDWNSDVLHPVEEYYVNILKWSRPRFKAFKPIVNLIISLVLFLQGKSDLGTPIKEYVAEYCNIDLKLNAVLLDLFSKSIATLVLKKVFEESRDRITNPNTGGSLGDLATQMVMAITSLRDGGADCFDLIEAVPFLQIYGRAEEKYLLLSKIDEDDLFPPEFALAYFSPTEFRKIFDAVDIPLDDKGFYRRHRDVLILQAMKTARIMTSIIKKQVMSYPAHLRPLINAKC